MNRLCTSSVHVITANGQTQEQFYQSCFRISTTADVSNIIGQDLGRPALEFICSGWRVKPKDSLKDPSTLNYPVIVVFLWDCELPTKVKMRLRISKSSEPVSTEDERKSFKPLVLGCK